MGGRGKSSDGKAVEKSTGGGSASDATQKSVTSEGGTDMKSLRNGEYAGFINKAGKDQYTEGASRGLTRDETDLVHSYTDGLYRKVNEQLRDGKASVQTKAIANKINAALDKLPAYQGTVYRAVKMQWSSDAAKFAKKISEGKDFKFGDFLSTSRVSGGYGKSASLQLIITSKHGRSIEKLSNNKVEREILFKSGSRFKYISHSKSNKGQITVKIEEI